MCERKGHTKTCIISIPPNAWCENFFTVRETDDVINRKPTKHLGLPSHDTYMASGGIKYRANNKIWECTILRKESSKYNRRQILNHANASYREKISFTNQNWTRAHIEKENDRVLQTEHDYGRVDTEVYYDAHAAGGIRRPQCARCIYKPFAMPTPTKAGIKIHLPRRNEMGK